MNLREEGGILYLREGGILNLREEGGILICGRRGGILNLQGSVMKVVDLINPLNAELNPICHLLALLGAQHIFHVGRIRVNVAQDTRDWRTLK